MKAKQKRKVVKAKKKTITICSSASFYEKALAVEDELKRMGFLVKVPLTANKMRKSKNFSFEVVKPWLKDPKAYARKTFLTRHHFNKVVEGDSILVLNYEKNGVKGYIGGAVLAEMALALHFKKPIYVLNPLPEKVTYLEELWGMQPIILNGDLSRIR